MDLSTHSQFAHRVQLGELVSKHALRTDVNREDAIDLLWFHLGRATPVLPMLHTLARDRSTRQSRAPQNHAWSLR